MAYGKEDFVIFSDIEDLNLLLGDFTESEYNYSDSDEESDKVRKNNQTKCAKNKTKLYQRDECINSYASISGLRGHLRSKHGKQNIKVSQYRKGSQAEEKTGPFKLDQAEFNEVFRKIVHESLKHVLDNKFRKCSESVNGKFIVELASNLMKNENVLEKLVKVLQPIYYNVLSTAAGADNNTNEALLRTFHTEVFNEQLTTTVMELCEELGPNPRLRQFTAVLHRQLISDIIENRG